MRAWIYDRLMTNLFGGWYTAVLNRLPEGALLLDVGIGTAGSLSRNAALVRQRDIHVMGVDIDPDYLRQAQTNLERAGLLDRVRVRHISIFEFQERGFDAAYFSASFMLMPDPERLLKHVHSLLKPGGSVYFTQTFQDKRSPLVEKVKPLLHKVTTIHFGQVTYEDDFFRTLASAGFEATEHVRLGGNNQQSFRLIAASPKVPVV